ncbi:MAG TPA: hypothetical protein VIU64_14565 [Polyangia bacterium]
MKMLTKLMVAFVLTAFGASAAYACDGMKGHEKAEKGDQASPSTAKSGKTDTKADQKS